MTNRTRPYRSARAFLTLLMAVLVMPVPAVARDEPFTVRTAVAVPMSDGIHLTADVFIPNEGTAFPVVLMRSPYGRAALSPYLAEPLARRSHHLVEPHRLVEDGHQPPEGADGVRHGREHRARVGGVGIQVARQSDAVRAPPRSVRRPVAIGVPCARGTVRPAQAVEEGRPAARVGRGCGS